MKSSTEGGMGPCHAGLDGVKNLAAACKLAGSTKRGFLTSAKAQLPRRRREVLGCLGTPNGVMAMGMLGGCCYRVSASLLGLVAPPHSGVGVGMLWGDAGDASMVFSTSTLAAASSSTPWPKLRCGGSNPAATMLLGKPRFSSPAPWLGFRHLVPLHPLLQLGERRHPEEQSEGELLLLGHQCSECARPRP